MSETQDYKIDSEFTLPISGAEITRDLFEQRLKIVTDVIEDPLARRVFTRCQLTAMAFESLQLAKMLRRMQGIGHA